MRPPVVPLVAVVTLGILAPLACGLGDVFSASGLKPVVLTFVGDTLIRLDSTVPFTVTASAGGEVLERAHLAITSSDTTIVALTAGMDSLQGRKTGRATLTIRLLSSVVTDTTPTLQEGLRVRP